MRKSYEVTRDESPIKGDSIKQEYSRMLQSMMKSMKDNYQVIPSFVFHRQYSYRFLGAANEGSVWCLCRVCTNCRRILAAAHH